MPHDSWAHGMQDATPGGRLVFHVFAVLAQFIRELIARGTDDGLDAPGPGAPGSAARRPRRSSRPQDGSGLSERGRGSRSSPLTCCETLAQRL
ncbi:hypothetical protein ACFCZT_33030 [Streptomyces sp. NPDC056230]|uniref:hypothetical protein n=1 Tax=Streptomyces sp. NPDC056230 TaxID=3345754 RepID=UPI0035D6EE42